MALRSMRVVTVLVFSAAALDVTIIALFGSWDVHAGPLHLGAQFLFKPLLYLNAAFVVALLVGRADSGKGTAGQPRYWPMAIALLAAVYGVSFSINLGYPDWTHRVHTSGVSPVAFFVMRQGDGYYRPLGFLSLWMDNAFFGPHLWAYHLQNLALQLINGFLVTRIARRIGLGLGVANWAGLLFLVCPVGFEPVIWPGARFDLLAAAFTLVALDRALNGSAILSTAAYVVAVLCKESAYAYPLLLCILFAAPSIFAIAPDRKRRLRIVLVAAGATAALVAVRVAVYGNLGGYPDVVHGGTVNFVVTPRGAAALFTRFPAALYVVNSLAGMPLWLRVAVLAYVGALVLAVAAGARLGRYALVLVLSFVTELPAANIIGWMRYSAQASRFLYLPAVWMALAMTIAVAQSRRPRVLLPLLLTCFSAGSLWNTLAYVRMLHAVRTEAEAAVRLCRRAGCCHSLVIHDAPISLYGANYSDDQLIRDIQARLPGVMVGTDASAGGMCAVELRWAQDQQAP